MFRSTHTHKCMCLACVQYSDHGVSWEILRNPSLPPSKSGLESCLGDLPPISWQVSGRAHISRPFHCCAHFKQIRPLEWFGDGCFHRLHSSPRSLSVAARVTAVPVIPCCDAFSFLGLITRASGRSCSPLSPVLWVPLVAVGWFSPSDI